MTYMVRVTFHHQQVRTTYHRVDNKTSDVIHSREGIHIYGSQADAFYSYRSLIHYEITKEG